MAITQLISAMAPALNLPQNGQALSFPQMILFGIFFFLVGACVGSFLNVVIWRLPNRGQEVIYQGKRGLMSLSWPPSHCPLCDAPIRWYQNIPVLSYVLLGGRCAKCRAAIALRYPLVELATAMLWGGLFLAYFVGHLQGQVCWRHGGTGIDNLPTDWAPYVWHCALASALLAASAIDADLFIIPLSIPWFVAILGVAGAAVLGPSLTRDYAIVPTLADGGWTLAKPILGATAGLILANVLLSMRILPRSFPWEMEGSDNPSSPPKAHDSAAAKPESAEKKDHGQGVPREEPLAPPPKLTRFWPAVIAALIIIAAIVGLWAAGRQKAAALAGIAGAILVFLLGVLPRDAGQVDVSDEVMEEISGPGVRREILKEVLFLALPAAGALAGHFLPGQLPPSPWLMRVLGSLLGLLVGGGMVWLVRVGGSLAFNKQAMGIGDVHLMAAVGTVLGAPLVVVAFFTAPFVGLLWAALLKLMGKPNVLPYGPWLSVASIMALVLGDPIIRFYLTLFP
jgi:prepilin signal peptidase PulO-like enzyme (type II secretory pathway)